LLLSIYSNNQLKMHSFRGISDDRELLNDLYARLQLALAKENDELVGRIESQIRELEKIN